MLQNISYRACKRILPGDSFMPLRTKSSDMSDPGITIDGYEMVWDPESESWLFTHVLADWYNLWKGTYTTEAAAQPPQPGFNTLNKSTPNAARPSKAAHPPTPPEHIGNQLHSPDERR